MSFINPINRMMLIDRLIRKKNTGTPKELAQKVGVSERALYESIGHLKDHFNCPIAYCREQESYYYTEDGEASFGFKSDE